MVNLSTFYDLNVYNTEGKFLGQITEVVLNIKKGRISFFKTKALSQETKSGGIADILRNSIRLEQDDGDTKELMTMGTMDIPYEVVSAVGDIILVDQNKLIQYQNDLKVKEDKNQQVKRPISATRK
ncbi:MAG: photosystem reaction center subunit H [Methanosphaera sp. rholeuAM130]|nr:MAG: photosystem reaction center subunit H [Methanosphaera sp. rholeuAM130]